VQGEDNEKTDGKSGALHRMRFMRDDLSSGIQVIDEKSNVIARPVQRVRLSKRSGSLPCRAISFVGE
jgi:hypothetical protein